MQSENPELFNPHFDINIEYKYNDEWINYYDRNCKHLEDEDLDEDIDTEERKHNIKLEKIL